MGGRCTRRYALADIHWLYRTHIAGMERAASYKCACSKFYVTEEEDLACNS